MAANNLSLYNLWWHSVLYSVGQCSNNKTSSVVCLWEWFSHLLSLSRVTLPSFILITVIYITYTDVIKHCLILLSWVLFHQKYKISHALHLNTEQIFCPTYWHLNLIMIHAMHLHSFSQWRCLQRISSQTIVVVSPLQIKRPNLYLSY